MVTTIQTKLLLSGKQFLMLLLKDLSIFTCKSNIFEKEEFFEDIKIFSMIFPQEKTGVNHNIYF